MKRDDLSKVNRRLSVAPMMDWTDKHCRYFHRLLSKNTLLYTEMVTAPALVHGDVERLVGHDPAEYPLALQIGGAEPDQIARAVRRVNPYGFVEINLNVGCPSDRVQSGAFGAILMKDIPLVVSCLKAMQDSVEHAEITVKCRIGVDEQIPEIILPEFIHAVSEAGVRSLTIHARKAWLKGLSPKDNRSIPALDYGLVKAMKSQFPDCEICINGGISDLTDAKGFLDSGLDGVMIGRAAYHQPFDILMTADKEIFGISHQTTENEVIEEMIIYAERQMKMGARLNSITRHMLGAFAGQAGARAWRRLLSENMHLPNANPSLIAEAYEAIKIAKLAVS